ncbi:hypothetical protein [Streptomyces sp. NPDC016845]
MAWAVSDVVVTACAAALLVAVTQLVGALPPAKDAESGGLRIP